MLLGSEMVNWLAVCRKRLTVQTCRLTVQTSGEATCSQVEACMAAAPPDLTSGDPGIMVSGDDGVHGTGDDEDDYPEDHSGHSDQNDERTPTSTSAAISTSLHSAGACWRFKELFVLYNISQWLPKCNCHGLYKPVQCKEAIYNDFGRAECWCASSLRGSSILGTRKRFQCTDPALL